MLQLSFCVVRIKCALVLDTEQLGKEPTSSFGFVVYRLLVICPSFHSFFLFVIEFPVFCWAFALLCYAYSLMCRPFATPCESWQPVPRSVTLPVCTEIRRSQLLSGDRAATPWHRPLMLCFLYKKSSLPPELAHEFIKCDPVHAVKRLTEPLLQSGIMEDPVKIVDRIDKQCGVEDQRYGCHDGCGSAPSREDLASSPGEDRQYK